MIFAMLSEAIPTVNKLGLIEVSPPWGKAPSRLYMGKFEGLELSCLVNGIDEINGVDLIGPVPATYSATLACSYIKPDVIVSCGTAGLLSEDLSEIGKTYLSKQKCIFHDRNVPLPGFDVSSLGNYPVLDVSDLAFAIGASQGIVSSGSSLALSQADINIMQANNAKIKDMECAAIAWVCSLSQTPFFAIKSITNVLLREELSEDQFIDNFDLAVSNLSFSVYESISFIAKNECLQS
jgi:nucleoside phosphorylase